VECCVANVVLGFRADLKDESVRREYERGYKVALDFLDKYMG